MLSSSATTLDLSDHLRLRLSLPALLVHHGTSAGIHRLGSTDYQCGRAAACALHLSLGLRHWPLRHVAVLRGLGPRSCHSVREHGVYPVHFPMRDCYLSGADHSLPFSCRLGRERKRGHGQRRADGLLAPGGEGQGDRSLPADPSLGACCRPYRYVSPHIISRYFLGSEEHKDLDPTRVLPRLTHIASCLRITKHSGRLHLPVHYMAMVLFRHCSP